ncbi:hypothetical protein [Desulfovibrio inopinatus]|uniref:LPD3 domain-containing protein n=1 Tax=Desulfovibrio inopinatus TaxID=102109 RepID=UPI0004102BB1|nr:hypothetical protein [Desulfovibrio inopinatus]
MLAFVPFRPVHPVATQHGTILTTDHVLRDLIPYDIDEETLGKVVLGAPSVRPAPGSGVVAQALDDQGRVVSEAQIDPSQTEEAVQAMQDHSPTGHTRVIPTGQALQERHDGFLEDQARQTQTSPELSPSPQTPGSGGIVSMRALDVGEPNQGQGQEPTAVSASDIAASMEYPQTDVLPEQIEESVAPLNSTNASRWDHFETNENGDSFVGSISPSTADDIEALGLSLQSPDVFATPGDIQHIEESHGDQLTDDDIELIQHVVQNPTEILPNIATASSPQRGRRTLFVRSNGKKFVGIVEISQDGSGNILRNYWKMSQKKAERYLKKYREEKDRRLQLGGAAPSPIAPDDNRRSPVGLSGGQAGSAGINTIVSTADNVNTNEERTSQPFSPKQAQSVQRDVPSVVPVSVSYAEQYGPKAGTIVEHVEQDNVDAARNIMKKMPVGALKPLAGVDASSQVGRDELVETVLERMTADVAATRAQETPEPMPGSSPVQDSAGQAVVGIEGKSTAHEKGVTGKPRADMAIQHSEDWDAAKTGDLDAARRIVSSVWQDSHTEAVKAKLDPQKETVFVSVPSTTGSNTLPLALGEELTTRMGGVLFDGKVLFEAEHDAPMKSIPPQERPFVAKEYVAQEGTNLTALQGKNVVVVEDVLTTGASAKAFVRALKKAGISVDTVAGLMGDARLDAEPQLVAKLQKAFARNNIPLNAKKTASVLSRGEVNVILDQINKSRTTDDRQAIARDLQRVLDERTAGVLGTVLRRQGTGSTSRKTESNAFLSPGIQDRAGLQAQSERPQAHGTDLQEEITPSPITPSSHNKSGVPLSSSASDTPHSHPSAPKPSRPAMSNTEASAHIDRWTKGLKGVPEIDIREDGEPGTKGMYQPASKDGKTPPKVTIFANNHTSEADLRNTFKEEVMNHHGVRLALGEQYEAFMTKAYENQAVQDMAAKLEKERGDSFHGNRAIAADEAIAALGRQGWRSTIMDKLVSTVRRFMRRLWPDMKVTDREIRDVIGRSYKAVRTGTGSAASHGPTLTMFSKDQPADAFLEAPGGGRDFGHINDEMAQAMGSRPGPIRLQNGDEKFGAVHIDQRHGPQIQQRGFKDTTGFISHITKNFNAIFKGNTDRHFVLTVRGNRIWPAAIVKMEYSPNGEFYKVVTASPVRKDQYLHPDGVHKKKLLWEGTQDPHRDHNSQTPGVISGQRSDVENITPDVDPVNDGDIMAHRDAQNDEQPVYDPEARVDVVELDSATLPADMDWKDAKAVRNWLFNSADFDTPVQVKKTGETVTFTRRGLKESTKRRGEQQRQAYGALRRLIENAAFFRFEPATQEKHRHLFGQNVYYAALRLGGRDYSVKIKVNLSRAGDIKSYKDHKISEIEVASPMSPTQAHEHGGQSAWPASKNQDYDATSSYPVRVLAGEVNADDGIMRQRDTQQSEKSPLPHDDIDAIIAEFNDATPGAAPVRVFENTEEAEAFAGQNMRGVNGFYDPKNGIVGLIANRVKSAKDLLTTLVHEQKRHHGLRVFLGDQYQAVMDKAWKNPAVQAKIRELMDKGYSWNLRSLKGRRKATDEAISWLADEGWTGSLVDRIIAAVRQWLRKMPRFSHLEFSDAEVRTLIGNAERAVMKPTKVQEATQTGRKGSVEPVAAQRDEKDSSHPVYDPDARVQVVELDSATLPADMDWKDAKAVRNWLFNSADFDTPVQVKKTGETVTFTRRGLKESAKRRGKQQRQAYGALRRLIENAAFFRFEPTDDRHRNLLGQNVYYAVLRMNGEDFSVKIKVDIHNIGGLKSYKDHKISSIEVASPMNPTRAHEHGGQSARKDLTNQDRDATSSYPVRVLAGEVNADDILAQRQSRPSSPFITKRVQRAIDDFARQLDQYFDGKFNKRRHFTLGPTPIILKRLGVPNLPFTMRPGVIPKATQDKHFVRPESFYSLIQNLHDPIMVFESKDGLGNLVVMTEVIDEKGKTVMAAVHVNASMQHHAVNNIASFYGKTNENTFLNWINQGLLRYQNKQKSLAWSQSRELQLPKEGTKRGNKKILTEADFVNASDIQAHRGESFTDAESERRYQEARKGIGTKETFLDHVKGSWNQLATGFTRHFIHLPNEAKFAKARMVAPLGTGAAQCGWCRCAEHAEHHQRPDERGV